MSEQRREWSRQADRTRNVGREGWSPGPPLFLLAFLFLIHFQIQSTCSWSKPSTTAGTFVVPLLWWSFAPWHFGAQPWRGQVICECITARLENTGFSPEDFSLKYSWKRQRKEEKGQLSGRADVKFEETKSAILPLGEGFLGGLCCAVGFFRVRGYLWRETQETAEDGEESPSIEVNLKRWVS